MRRPPASIALHGALTLLAGMFTACAEPEPVVGTDDAEFSNALIPGHLPLVVAVEPQPLLAHAASLEEGLAFLGSELPAADRVRLAEIRAASHGPERVREIQELLDPYCLAMVHINPEARVKATRGPAAAELHQSGWRTFLVKVHNEAGVTAPLELFSENALLPFRMSDNEPRPAPDPTLTPGSLADRFLEYVVVDRRPLDARLSGLELQYVVLQLYSSDAGKRAARLGFRAGQGTQDLGFRETLDVLFDCKPAVRTTLRVKNADGEPGFASFLIRDGVMRSADDWEARWVNAYPLPSRRLTRDDEYPDFFFQPQVYRGDGEHVDLAPGTYEITVRRGPESLPQTRTVTIPEGVETHELDFQLAEWVDMSALGWYSVDHHVHAAGCSHYDAPAEGVLPEHMWRQALGEDLDVSCVLSWGPCWYFQKGFFDGEIHPLSTADNLMRFDVEVSGFPSSHAGHVCLLRLTEDDFPGTTEIEDWPSWTLPVLQWAKDQGGIVGYAHSGLGLEPPMPTDELPNLQMPRFDGIGANEYIVTVTHDAVDFISAGDTPPINELNIWYHTLNCGFRTRISGETDFPCLSDDRIGRGRSYVKLDGALDFDACMRAIQSGRSYVSDGRSHLVDFRVDGVECGTAGSEVRLAETGRVRVEARAAAYLPEAPQSLEEPVPSFLPPEVQAFFRAKPFWDVERARIPGTRKVPVELVVNGIAVERREIVADGAWNALAFDLEIEDSSWIALRVFPSSHTNPVFVLVDDRPIRASADSAEWCRTAVDRCWDEKSPLIEARDLEAARAGYDHARRAYERILDEARARGR